MERDEPEIGYFYKWFKELKEIQLKIQELPLQWKCLSKFIDKLITNIEKKVYCVKEYKQHILIGTFLDRQHITGMGNEDREQAKSLILTNFSHFYKPMPENNTRTDNPDNPANLSDSQLLDEVIKTTPKKIRPIETTIKFDEELDRYMLENDCSDNKRFWNKRKSIYKTLYEVHLYMKTLIWSNGSVERVFSYAGILSGQRRNRISINRLAQRLKLRQSINK